MSAVGSVYAMNDKYVNTHVKAYVYNASEIAPDFGASYLYTTGKRSAANTTYHVHSASRSWITRRHLTLTKLGQC